MNIKQITVPETGKPPIRLLNLNSAAQYIGVSYWMLRTLLHNCEIPFIRIGRRLLVDRQDLDSWIEKSKRREESF